MFFVNAHNSVGWCIIKSTSKDNLNIFFLRVPGGLRIGY